MRSALTELWWTMIAITSKSHNYSHKKRTHREPFKPMQSGAKSLLLLSLQNDGRILCPQSRQGSRWGSQREVRDTEIVTQRLNGQRALNTTGGSWESDQTRTRHWPPDTEDTFLIEIIGTARIDEMDYFNSDLNKSAHVLISYPGERMFFWNLLRAFGGPDNSHLVHEEAVVQLEL